MAERIGKYTLKFGSRPGIIASAAIVGSKEGDGPLGGSFDEIITDGTFGEKTWEKAESAFQHRAVVKAIEKSGMTAADIDMLMAGDLLSQCSGSAFGARDLGIPFVGLYGACSTMALSLALAALSVDSGAASIAAAATSSHFCSAEKQFRTPLEYGGQRPPTAQWTATAAGCAVIGKSASPHDCLEDFGIEELAFDLEPAAYIEEFRRQQFVRSNRSMLPLPAALGAIRLTSVEDEVLDRHAHAYLASRNELL